MPNEFNNIYEIVNKYLKMNNEEEIEVFGNDINDLVNFYSTLPVNLESRNI